MNLLFCGLGQIAKRHIDLIRRDFPQFEIYALRTQNKTSGAAAGVREIFSWEEADRQVFAAAFITSPTHLHVSQSLECARRGIPLFIEKPLGASWEGLQELLRVIDEKKLPSYVAYCFRFHPLVQEFKKRLSGRKVLHSRIMFGSYMPGWRTKQNFRESYTVFNAQGGGVVLDCSHEIDMLEFLLGEISEIQGQTGRVSGLTVDAEDYADMLVRHSQGVTPVHLDYFSRVTQRYVEVDTPDTFLRMDLKKQTICMSGGGEPVEESFQTAPDQMYAEQLRYFFKELAARRPMMNSAAQAARLLKVILAFRGTIPAK